MKNKFWFLTKQSLKKKICTKWFLGINILLLILIPCMVNIDSVIKFFGGDFDDPVNVYIYEDLDIYDELEDTINNNFMNALDSYNIIVKKGAEDLEKLKSEIIEEEKDDIIINLIPSENTFDADIISFEYIDNILYQCLTASINTVKTSKALVDSGIDLNELAKAYEGVKVNRIYLDENINENEELLQLIGAILVGAFILPAFFLIITIIQMIGAEINEEKTSRTMEIMISSVSPKIHFLSKLISSNIFAILQGTLLILYSGIGIGIRAIVSKGSLSIPSTLIGTAGAMEGGSINYYINMFLNSTIFTRLLNGIPLFILILVFSFFAYSLLTGILASMTTSMEDYQQLQTPIMMFLMAGYFLAIFAATFDGATLLKVASFIPFVSGILAPVTYILEQITLLQLGISVCILVITCFILYKYGLKVYKVGILNYSSNNLWKKMFKSLKNKN